MTTIKIKPYLTVKDKRFHYIWLRENCSSCRYAAPYQQLHDPNISDRPEIPQPRSVELTEEKLIIDWDETPGHRSIFDVDWLLANAYDPQPIRESDNYLLWDKTQIELQSPKVYDSGKINDDAWLNQLFSLGFVVIENIAPQELESWLSATGPIYNVDYGRIFALKTRAKTKESLPPRDGCALPPHNDISYLGSHRVAQFLYCVDHQAVGGESFLVDGFRVAEDFCRDYPHYFQLLVETPVQFWLVDSNHQYRFCNTAPILERDSYGNLTTVRFSKRNCRPHLPFDQLAEFYQAFNTFFRYLKNPDYQHQFRLKAGDCLLFQNFRILHGRTAFDPATGNRKLNSGYVDWNFFVGRKNFQNQEF